MSNGSGPAKTSIGLVADGGIFARGYDVADDLLGKLGFSAYFYLLVCGEVPNARQARIVDAILVALSDPSLNGTHQAARIAFSSNPAALQLSLASGFLAAHPKLVGEVDSCIGFLQRLKQEIYESDHSSTHILKERLKVIRAERGSVPGIGAAKPTDQLAARLLSFAESEKSAHTYLSLVKQLHVEYVRTFEQRDSVGLPMAIAALQLELELPAQLTRYLPWLAQAGTMLAHLSEEHQRPIAPTLLSAGVGAVSFEN